MSYFAATTIKEIKRMEALCNAYERQLSELPKGSLQVKKRKGKQYYYLTYRKDDKIISKYEGKDESAIAELMEKIKRRKGIEKLIKSIKKEIAIMNKALEAAK